MTREEETTALAEAMWQLLDDMGKDGKSVCLLAKAHARIAFEPFRDKSEGEFDDWISVTEAQRIVDDVEWNR